MATTASPSSLLWSPFIAVHCRAFHRRSSSTEVAFGKGRRQGGASWLLDPPGLRQRIVVASWEIKASGGQSGPVSVQSVGTMKNGEVGAKTPSWAKIYLYMSHALSTWGERAWEFAVGLAILQMTDNLRLVSIYGLVAALGNVVFSAPVGAFIDRNLRVRSVTIFYLLQNASLVLAALSTLLLLQMHDKMAIDSNWCGYMLATSMVFWGMISAVGQAGSTVVVEKKWAKEICGDDQNSLASVNSIFRTIDLCCLIVAPIVSGFLMTYVDSKVAIMEIAGFNLVVWIPEVIFARLAEKHTPETKLEEMHQPLLVEDSEHGEKTKNRKITSPISDIFTSLKLYYTESSFPAMFALALLYLTALSLGILMTAYLKWLGLSEAVLSIYRGVAAFSGVLGARLYPLLQRGLGIKGAGVLGISIQLISLVAGVAPSIVMTFMGTIKDAKLMMHCLVWGLIASRFGLWVFDLSVTQTIQTHVDPGRLGIVSGAQKLHENLFTVILYVIVIAVPRPEHFIWLMIGSLCTVGSAFAIYNIYYVKERITSGRNNSQENV